LIKSNQALKFLFNKGKQISSICNGERDLAVAVLFNRALPLTGATQAKPPKALLLVKKYI
jgi:hypothetical protein